MLCSFDSSCVSLPKRPAGSISCRRDARHLAPVSLFHESPVTVNFAVNRFTFCAIDTHHGTQIVLRSKDLGVEETFESPAHLQAAKRYRLPILARLIRYFEPESGFTMESTSEAPAGAGISGSSALMILDRHRTQQAHQSAASRSKKFAKWPRNVEAQVIRVPTGAQDWAIPLCTVSISSIELTPMPGIIRKALPVRANELDERFVLVYTGSAPRNSGHQQLGSHERPHRWQSGHPSQFRSHCGQ